MRALVLAISISLCVLVSPEVQVLLGHSVGMAGTYFYPTLIVVVAIAYVTLQGYGDRHTGEVRSFGGHYGFWLTLTSLLASRVLFFVTCSTIVLATAGYVFNEVFVSSFPNFGFAFLVLGLVLLANLLNPKLACFMQVLFIGLWVSGMLYLVVSGIGTEPHSKSSGEFVFSARGLFLPFLLLVGIELPLAQSGDKKLDIDPGQLWLGYLFVMVLLAGWAFIMTRMLNPSLLSSSYIPHTKTASRLLGDPGRIALGIAMIGGTGALVNGLLQVLVMQIKDICQKAVVDHQDWYQSKWFQRLLVLVLGISPGLMMAKGMAGYDITEVYIRAALIFWLLHYGLFNLMVCRLRDGLFKLMHGLSFLLLLLVSCGLVYTDGSPQELLQIMGYVLLVTGCFSGVARLICFSKSKPLFR